jgi:DNA-binding LacI/PurR family transcriptional regulator
MERDRPDVLVGANDDVAIACLDLLTANGVRVPEECAVVGFDDSAQAEPAQLTSYSFNAPAVVLEALRFGQTCPERSGPCRELVVDGFVVRRRTG